MSDYSLLNDPEMTEIFESFVIETQEILEKLNTDLVKLESDPENTNLLNEIFRSFHTIKGTAGFLGLVKMQSLTHKLEDILNKLRKSEIKIDSQLMDVILRGYDKLIELLSVIENNKNEDLDIELILTDLTNKLSQVEFGNLETNLENKKAEIDEQELVVITKETIDNLSEAEIEKAFIENNKKLKAQKSNGLAISLFENINSQSEDSSNKISDNVLINDFSTYDKKNISLNETSKNLKQKDQSNNKIEKSKSNSEVNSQKSVVEQTTRVDVDRLDDLLNLISELVLGRNRLTQLNQDVLNEYEGTEIAKNLTDTTRQIDLLTTELQLAVMRTRMIKIGKVFNKFPRLVRDLSKETKKEIQLVIKGEETELDKTLIEEINDPLVHLIRNSVDHGIELPEERIKIGKNPIGTITLSAEHEGNHIIISIEDDGKGINPEVIINKAISKGLIAKEKAVDLSEQEIYNFIFAPGFSTAEKVTNVSGRGVGMDVVKTNVTKLRGIIDIESQLGKGTKIFIKLPLTLAIIQGLLVKIVGETIVIPLNSVIEIVKLPKDEIYFINSVECIKLRDRVLPLINIDKLLYHSDTQLKDDNYQFIVVVGIAEKRYGIKVDSLVGQKEIVIKSLGKYLSNINGIAGSTIMGDGKVVMIVDIAEIISKLKN